MLHASKTCRHGSRLRGTTPSTFSRLLSSSKPKAKANTSTSTNKSSNRTRDLLISGTSICCVLGALYYFEYRKKEAATKRNISKSVGKASVGGPFSLFTADGVPVTDATYRGHYVLLYFGFTFCPDICPNEINKLTKVINVLEENKQKGPPIIPLFVTIDPKRDTIGQLKYYSGDFDSRFRWLTGTTEQIDSVTKAYRVYIGKVDEEEEDEQDSGSGELEEYLVDHSSYIYLLSPEGQCVDFYGKGQEIGDIADSVQLHMLNAGR